MELNLICSNDDLRPAMMHVKITKENMVATNAHVLGVIPTKEVFSDEFIEGIPENGMLIHKDDYKKLKNFENATWKSKDVIEIHYRGKKRNVLIPICTEENVGTFPKWETLIPREEDAQELSKIGVNMSLAYDLQRALDAENLKMVFIAPNKGILVKPLLSNNSKSYGIIMPAMIV